ncbi:MAG TPA: hypothetical protein VM513_18270 [Kofleriaceae bacterium]|jgi:hypothetical protein|nr:hypothetical protein [Kofleriaceae bacterium]
MGNQLASVAAVVALLAQGCSIITTRGAPDTIQPGRPPDCTTSKAAVYGDGLLGGAAIATSLFLGIAALAKEAELGDDETNDLAYATLFTFFGSIGFSVSGIVGGVRVRSCRRAHDQWRLQQALPPGASPYTPPPPPYAPR